MAVPGVRDRDPVFLGCADRRCSSKSSPEKKAWWLTANHAGTFHSMISPFFS
jgi:hypothetical protein